MGNLILGKFALENLYYSTLPLFNSPNRHTKLIVRVSYEILLLQHPASLLHFLDRSK